MGQSLVGRSRPISIEVPYAVEGAGEEERGDTWVVLLVIPEDNSGNQEGGEGPVGFPS